MTTSNPQYIILAIVASSWMVSTITDLRFARIPNVVPTLCLLLSVLVYLVSYGFHGVLLSILPVVGFLPFLLAAWLKGWMGGGDVKLALALAAALGWPRALEGLLLGGVAVGLWSLAYVVWSSRGAALWAGTRAVLGPVWLRQRLPLALPWGAGAIAAMLVPWHP
jgi:Flp pilus assembly protein protease CpaA